MINKYEVDDLEIIQRSSTEWECVLYFKDTLTGKRYELNEFIDRVNSMCVKLNLFRNVILANPCCYEGLRDELVDALKVELFEGDIEDVKE